MINNSCSETLIEIQDLHCEVVDIYQRVVQPLHSEQAFTQTLYGYMHRVFAYVDLLSAYWCGSDSGKQTLRMVDFMETYFGSNRRAHNLAIAVWRHKLVHTAQPRTLLDSKTGSTIHYMIQWHAEQMPAHQPHYSIIPFASGEEVFNVGLIPLCEDLARSAHAFVADIAGSSKLQKHETAFGKKLTTYSLKEY